MGVGAVYSAITAEPSKKTDINLSVDHLTCHSHNQTRKARSSPVIAKHSIFQRVCSAPLSSTRYGVGIASYRSQNTGLKGRDGGDIRGPTMAVIKQFSPALPPRDLSFSMTLDTD